MADPPVLYHMPISHYCVCAERLLAFKGVRFRTVSVPYHDKRELIAGTGQDYVPALVWDGTVVPWAEIPGFVEGKVPTPTLFPDGRRALAETIDSWGHLVLEERVWRAVVTRVPPRFVDPVERWVFEEMQNRARGPWAVLEARRPEFWNDLQPYLRLVDGMVAEGPFVLGTASLADFGLFGALSPMLQIGESVPEEFASLRSWIARVEAIGDPPAALPRRTMK